MFKVEELNGIYVIKIYDTNLLYCNEKKNADLIALILNVDHSENAMAKAMINDLIERVSKVIFYNQNDQIKFDDD